MVVALLITSPAVAAEIQYAHVEEVHDTELHIQYKGPGAEQNFVCAVTTYECESFGTSTPTLFPEIDESTSYSNSPDGRWGIVATSVEAENGSTTYTHTLYDVSGDVAVEQATLPFTKEVVSYKFPWASDRVVLFGVNGEVATYDIAAESLDIIEPSQSEFPLRSLSPHARYLSAYNYSDAAHKIWDTKTGDELMVESDTPAFVEFSQNERYAAFTDDRDGYQTLYLVDVTSDESETERVFASDLTVEDYLWFQNELYAVGNTEDNPYRWVMYRYDPAADEPEIVAEDVSYGDYIRPIGEYALSFLQIDGKNTNVALYDAMNDEVQVIQPVADSPASAQIDRSILEFDDGVNGVLYEPLNPDRKPDLFVWLHGGPKRQTSYGYHSYLSYAVYDELLERLVESGAYVLKLDYAGSYGHGSEFMDQLTNRLGDLDVHQVTSAARTLQSDYDIDDTYLIGNSYGGYLGPKTLVEEDRVFDGAIAINGVFDWFDLLARIPSSPFKVYFDGLANLADTDENFPLYEQASIVSALPELGQLKRLLLIYGEDDATVPTWQTEEFFYQATTLGKSVSLLQLEDEDHIIRNRDSLTEMCEFIADKLLITDLKCR